MAQLPWVPARVPPSLWLLSQLGSGTAPSGRSATASLLPAPQKRCTAPLAAMRASGHPGDGAQRGAGGGLGPEPYDGFMRCHLRYYGYFRGERWARGRGLSPLAAAAAAPAVPKARRRAGRRAPQPRGAPASSPPPRLPARLPAGSRAVAEL